MLIYWCHTPQTARVIRELRQENARLTADLRAFDPQFFEDIDALKVR